MPVTRSDRQAFVKDLLLLLGLPALILAALAIAFWPRPKAPFDTGREGGQFEVAAGAWDWSTADSVCLGNPHTITFTPDRKRMFIAFRTPWTDSTGASHRVSTYDVLASSSSHIRGAIRGETRMTDEGVPVVWDLVLTSDSSYAWHRTDWEPGAQTAEVVRCPVGTDTTIAPPDSDMDLERAGAT